MNIVFPGTECPPRCPGCPYRHLNLDDSAARKIAWLKKRLSPWEDRFLPIATPSREEIPGYRQKTCLSAAWTPGGWQFGLKRGLEIIPIPGCPIHSGKIHRGLEILTPLLPPASVFPSAYWVQSGAQVVLVIKSNIPPDTDWLDNSAATALADAGIEGVWLHLFPSVGKKVFAKSGWRLIYGAPRSRSVDGFIHGPTAFQQVFPGLHEKSMKAAVGFLDPGPDDRVIDLYSGIGRTLARWTGSGAKAAGVELCGEAVECAGENAPLAGLFRGTCAQRLIHLDGWLAGSGGYDDWLLYANPPRTGLELAVIDWTIERRPRKIAYLSCSAGTLRRDLDLLCAAGYRVAAIAPFDFFPLTRHVETLVVLKEKRIQKPEAGMKSKNRILIQKSE